MLLILWGCRVQFRKEGVVTREGGLLKSEVEMRAEGGWRDVRGRTGADGRQDPICSSAGGGQ